MTATRPASPSSRERHGDNLLEIRGLKTHFFTQDGTVKAVDGVSLEIKYGQTLGVVGESGCGKSITALSMMRLVERPGRTVAGEILLDGRDLLKLGDDEMSEVRGNEISMIFQEPMTSLNPVFTCGDQIAEAVALHKKVSGNEAWDRAIEMLQHVGIADAEAARQELPAPAVRRHAAARHDRDGALVRTPSCSSPTSRPPPSTSRSRRRSSSCLTTLQRAEQDGDPCSSPTTSAWSPRWPTRSS